MGKKKSKKPKVVGDPRTFITAPAAATSSLSGNTQMLITVRDLSAVLAQLIEDESEQSINGVKVRATLRVIGEYPGATKFVIVEGTKGFTVGTTQGASSSYTSIEELLATNLEHSETEKYEYEILPRSISNSEWTIDSYSTTSGTGSSTGTYKSREITLDLTRFCKKWMGSQRDLGTDYDTTLLLMAWITGTDAKEYKVRHWEEFNYSLSKDSVLLKSVNPGKLQPGIAKVPLLV